MWLLISHCFLVGYSNRVSHVGPQTTATTNASEVTATYNVWLGGLFPIHSERSGGLQRCGEIAEYGFEMAMAMVYAVETIHNS